MSENAPHTSETARLLSRLARDQYSLVEHNHDRYVLGWNHAMGHAARIVRELENAAAVERGLRELATAPAVDYRLRHALIFGVPTISPSPLPAVPPAKVASSTPPEREVGGGFDVGGPQ